MFEEEKNLDSFECFFSACKKGIYIYITKKKCKHSPYRKQGGKLRTPTYDFDPLN